VGRATCSRQAVSIEARKRRAIRSCAHHPRIHESHTDVGVATRSHPRARPLSDIRYPVSTPTPSYHPRHRLDQAVIFGVMFDGRTFQMRPTCSFFFLTRDDGAWDTFWDRLDERGPLSCKSVVGRPFISNVPTSDKLWLELGDKWRPGDERKKNTK
jgi:hypothetical protein